MKTLNKNLMAIIALAIAAISTSAFANEEAKTEKESSEKVTYELAIKDHKFTPEELKVPAGKAFILNVQNNDASAEEFESHALKVEKVIAGNNSAKIHVKALKAGTYKFVGEFHEDVAKGAIIAE